ncbi:MAG: response regulator [Desulfocapsaceae bacterium]|nr:response regulator [Desulfocapsaceae bacterium]
MNRKQILVVDDDQDLRESIIEILTENGFAAVGCESAEAALRAIRIGPADIAIVDNMMPGMDGITLIPILKGERPGIKIIIITAFSTVDNAVTAMKSGADDYLAKPFKRDDLLVAVRRNLEIFKFEHHEADPNIDEALVCLANPIRRNILVILSEKREMRFMHLSRHLGISDHTKVNFHLKILKSHNLLSQDQDKLYRLTPQGKKMVECLDMLSRQFS